MCPKLIWAPLNIPKTLFTKWVPLGTLLARMLMDKDARLINIAVSRQFNINLIVRMWWTVKIDNISVQFQQKCTLPLIYDGNVFRLGFIAPNFWTSFLRSKALRISECASIRNRVTTPYCENCGLWLTYDHFHHGRPYLSYILSREKWKLQSNLLCYILLKRCFNSKGGAQQSWCWNL